MREQVCGCVNGRVFNRVTKQLEACKACTKGNQVTIESKIVTVDKVEVDESEKDQIMRELLIPPEYRIYWSYRPNFQLGLTTVLTPSINLIHKQWNLILDNLEQRAPLLGNYFFHIQQYDYSIYVYHLLMQARRLGYFACPYIGAHDLLSLAKDMYGLLKTDNKAAHEAVCNRIGYSLEDYHSADVCAVEITGFLIEHPIISNNLLEVIYERSKRGKSTLLFSTESSRHLKARSWFLNGFNKLTAQHSKLHIYESDSRGRTYSGDFDDSDVDTMFLNGGSSDIEVIDREDTVSTLLGMVEYDAGIE